MAGGFWRGGWWLWLQGEEESACSQAQEGGGTHTPNHASAERGSKLTRVVGNKTKSLKHCGWSGGQGGARFVFQLDVPEKSRGEGLHTVARGLDGSKIYNSQHDRIVRCRHEKSSSCDRQRQPVAGNTIKA